MDASADYTYQAGNTDYSLAWGLLTFLGVFGAHRFYLGKWITALLYFFTAGFLFLGVIYDFWTLNGQVSECNSRTVMA